MSAIEIATNFLKQWEGCRLSVYQDQAGVYTIGFGCTHIGDTTVTRLTPPITQAQADALLEAEVARVSAKVEQYVTAQINDNQRAALISFAYNEGTRALQTSTLLKMVNAGRINDAALEFGKWVYAGGKYNKGLANRRAAEAALFTSVPLVSVVTPSPSSTEDLNEAELERIQS